MAIMEISSWYTTCSECGRDTAWTPTHEVLLGYGPDNGKPGCGAEFTAVTFTYRFMDEEDPRDSDEIGWYPQWMKDLPLV